MNSDLLLGAVIGGVIVFILWNRQQASGGGCACGTSVASLAGINPLATSCGDGLGGLCSAQARY